MSNDRKTVSNDDYEIVQIAEELNLPRFVIHLAKFKNNSGDRASIKEWVKENQFLISYLMSYEV